MTCNWQLASLYVSTQEQSLCHLVLTKMKENLLAENAVLSHTETKKLVQTFIFN